MQHRIEGTGSLFINYCHLFLYHGCSGRFKNKNAKLLQYTAEDLSDGLVGKRIGRRALNGSLADLIDTVQKRSDHMSQEETWVNEIHHRQTEKRPSHHVWRWLLHQARWWLLRRWLLWRWLRRRWRLVHREPRERSRELLNRQKQLVFDAKKKSYHSGKSYAGQFVTFNICWTFVNGYAILEEACWRIILDILTNYKKHSNKCCKMPWSADTSCLSEKLFWEAA